MKSPLRVTRIKFVMEVKGPLSDSMTRVDTKDVEAVFLRPDKIESLLDDDEHTIGKFLRDLRDGFVDSQR